MRRDANVCCRILSGFGRFSMVAACIVAMCGHAQAQQVFSIDPPEAFRSQLGDLMTGNGKAESIRLLSSTDYAAPYLRLVIASSSLKGASRDAKDALGVIEERIRKRNTDRYSKWLREGRLDLCTELLATCFDNAKATEFSKDLLQVVDGIGNSSVKLLSDSRSPLGAREFGRAREVRHVADEEVSIGNGVGIKKQFVRAHRCEFGAQLMFGWLVTSLSEPKYTAGGEPHEWCQSMVFVNDNLSIRTSETTLFVCDGDVDLQDGGLRRWRRSIVIASGSIRCKSGDIDQTLLAASGSIAVAEQSQLRNHSLLLAGEKVIVGGHPCSDEMCKGDRTSLPFGIKFLDPKELGLQLAVQNGGIQVTDITAESPFAKFGVQDADVITRIDDVAPKSLPEFRRALRRGVIRESVVLHIKRDGKMITRIVFLDGVPAPVAPMPREVR